MQKLTRIHLAALLTTLLAGPAMAQNANGWGSRVYVTTGTGYAFETKGDTDGFTGALGVGLTGAHSQNRWRASAQWTHFTLTESGEKAKLDAAMVQGEYSFTMGSVSPYLGLGVGLGSLTAEGPGISDRTDIWLYKGIAGVDVPVTDTLTAYGEYNFYRVFGQDGGALSVHGLNIGLRASF